MNDAARFADLPLADRRQLEVDQQQEIQEGLMRRHLENGAEQQRILAAQFAHVLRVGPALAAKLRGK